VDEGPATGQSIVYFLAPWGLQMEIISYPKGMAYENRLRWCCGRRETRRSDGRSKPPPISSHGAVRSGEECI
jgi:hypothetical protein